MSLGSKAKWVACRGMSRSSWGRSHTTQQRPKRASYVMATSGNVCPQRGCRGSRTVMVCSGDTLCPRGVVPWLRFSNARRAGDQDVMPLSYPLAGGETDHHRLVQSPGMPIVDIFDAGRLTQFRLPQAGGESTGVPFRKFTVDQKSEAFLKAERTNVSHLELLDQGVVHAGKFRVRSLSRVGCESTSSFSFILL